MVYYVSSAGQIRVKERPRESRVQRDKFIFKIFTPSWLHRRLTGGVAKRCALASTKQVECESAHTLRCLLVINVCAPAASAAAAEVDNLQAQDVVNLRGNYANMVWFTHTRLCAGCSLLLLFILKGGERQTARVISFSCLSVWCCTAWNWVTRHFTLLICQKAGMAKKNAEKKIEAASAGAKHQRGNWCRHCIISCLQSRLMVEWGKPWRIWIHGINYKVV
jgi:hypothetical protein